MSERCLFTSKMDMISLMPMGGTLTIPKIHGVAAKKPLFLDLSQIPRYNSEIHIYHSILLSPFFWGSMLGKKVRCTHHNSTGVH